MKNKKSIYVLLPIAVIIWGIIAYKIITGLNSDNNDNFIEHANLKYENIIEADTFSLILAYRDPFLGKNIIIQNDVPEYQSNPYPQNKTNIVQKPEENKPAPVIWPKLAYKGIIQNNKTNNYVSLVIINNQKFLLSEGQELSGIKLLKAYKDSAVFQYSDQIKTLLK